MAWKSMRDVRDLVRKTHRKLTRDAWDLVRKTHRAVTLVAPWNFLVAVLALAVAVYELRVNRTLRETTLFIMASERLESARAMDERRTDPYLMVPTANAGQVRVLEEMVENDISLRNMDLRQVNLENAELPNADLRGANLWCTILVGANLSGSNFENANSQLVNFYDANLYHANFTGASVASSGFWISSDDKSRNRKGSLAGADFSDARLYGARFSRVLLAGTAFTNARFGNTRFENVDLREARGLSQVQLNNACREGDDVQLPDGYSIEVCDSDAENYAALCDQGEVQRSLR